MPQAVIGAILVFASIGCGPNDGVLKSGQPDANAANSTPKLSPIEQNISDMRTAGFTMILVLRRKDGGKMDAPDRKVIRDATYGANRRVGSDDETAFIIGSNQKLTPENMKIIVDRFSVEDLSPPPATPTPDNSNANK
jgi:hypothetical protein